MKYTNNFNLRKPDTNDFYDVEDNNSNLDNIDQEMKNLQDGQSASEILKKMKTVDGSGSGLDADKVNGIENLDKKVIYNVEDFTSTNDYKVNLPDVNQLYNGLTVVLDIKNINTKSTTLKINDNEAVQMRQYSAGAYRALTGNELGFKNIMQYNGDFFILLSQQGKQRSAHFQVGSNRGVKNLSSLRFSLSGDRKESVELVFNLGRHYFRGTIKITVHSTWYHSNAMGSIEKIIHFGCDPKAEKEYLLESHYNNSSSKTREHFQISDPILNGDGTFSINVIKNSIYGNAAWALIEVIEPYSNDILDNIKILPAVEETRDLETPYDISRIYEVGSNGNGEYVKYDNGMMICWKNGNHRVNYLNSSAFESTWTLPAPFVDSSYILNVTIKNGQGCWSRDHLKSYVSFAYDKGEKTKTICSPGILLRGGYLSSSDWADVEVMAVGKWK